jgi:glycosyltransferase involved in cell wall biosynthesis
MGPTICAMRTSVPLVSILTPFLNASRFLTEAVESVLKQSYSNWELLLINDGSTDASPSIAQAYAYRYPKQIFYFAHDDGKIHRLPATRNLGLRHCKGDLIALLDSDDIWFSTKLEQQVAELIRLPEAGMVFGRSEYWYDWEGSSAHTSKNNIPELAPPNHLYHPPELLKFSYPLGPLGSPCPSNLLIRSSTLKQVGGFVEGFQLYEDIALLAKIFLGYPVYVASECWDRYRIQPESISARARATGDDLRERALYFEWLGDYMTRTGIVDRELWKSYRAKTWEYRHPSAAAMVLGARRRMRPLKQLLKRLNSG